MEVQTKRCKHCKGTYGYHASGQYCFEKTNSPDYCPDCMEKILSALKDVPIKCKPILREGFSPKIDFEKDLLPLKEKFLNEKNKRINIVKYNGALSRDRSIFIDEYYYKQCHYVVSYKADGSIVEILCDVEHDLINDIITNKPWFYYGERDRYIQTNLSQMDKTQFERNLDLTESLQEMYLKNQVRKLPSPNGELYFFD